MSASPGSQVAPGGGEARALLWVAAATIAVRLAYLTEHLGSSFFGEPLLDEAFYDAVARALVSGADLADLTDLNPGFRPLLYPLLLAAARKLAGESAPLLTEIVQHLLGVVTALAAAHLAFRLFASRAAAVVAGLLLALAGPPLFFEGELLSETLFTALVALALVATVEALRRPGGMAWWLGAGGALGAAALVRPNALAALPAFALLAFVAREAPRGERLRRLVAPVLAAFALLALFALAVVPLVGRFQLVGGAGGVNLYLGNKRGADGMIPRQDRDAIYAGDYRDSVQLFADAGYRAELARRGVAPPPRLHPGEVSAYWTRRTAAEIAADPAAWLRLIARKVWLLAWNREVPNHKSWEFVVTEESRLLRLLPVRWWLLVALAPLGAAAAWRGGDRAAREGGVAVAAFALLLGAGIVAFFVNGRYRIPLWPPLAALAGGGAVDLARAAARGGRALAPRLAAAVALALVSLVNWPGVELPGPGRDFLFRSIAARAKGQDERAAADARRAVELDPGEAAAWFQLGLTEQDAGRLDSALSRYAEAARRRPDEPRTYNNAGVVLDQLGRTREAAAAYREALARAAYAPALVNLAVLELRAGLDAAAGERLARAAAAGFDSPSMAVAGALLAARAGRAEESAARLAALRARHGAALVDELVTLQSRPLDLSELAAD